MAKKYGNIISSSTYENNNYGDTSYSVKKGAVFLGTSITSFFGTYDPVLNSTKAVANSWAFWCLTTLGNPFTNIYPKGVGGDTSSGMLARFQTDVAAYAGIADTLFFEPGPNDFSHDEISLATIKANYKSIIEQALALSMTVIVISPTPSESPNPLTNPTALGVIKKQQVQAWLPGFLRPYANVLYIDSYQALSDAQTGGCIAAMYLPSEAASKVHPSDKGGKSLGKLVANKMGGLVDKTTLSTGKLAYNQLMPNPHLAGSNTSGTNNFYAGAGVTVTGGPDATAIAITGGTFTGITIAPYTPTGQEDDTTGGILLTINGALSDQAEVTLAFGANFNTLGGTQFGYLNGATGWAISKAIKPGDNILSAGYPTGIWMCVGAGTTASSGTVPQPVSTTNYGELKLDGTVLWCWKKLPAAGDVVQAEIPYQVISSTGSFTLHAAALAIVSNVTTQANVYGQSYFPYYDNTISNPGSGYPNTATPPKGSLRSLPMTLVTGSAGPIRYCEVDLKVICMTGASVTLYITGAYMNWMNS